jgi:hypothetical protein
MKRSVYLTLVIGLFSARFQSLLLTLLLSVTLSHAASTLGQPGPDVSRSQEDTINMTSTFDVPIAELDIYTRSEDAMRCIQQCVRNLGAGMRYFCSTVYVTSKACASAARQQVPSAPQK